MKDLHASLFDYYLKLEFEFELFTLLIMRAHFNNIFLY